MVWMLRACSASDQIGEGDLPELRPVNHSTQGVQIERRPRRLVDVMALAMNVGRREARTRSSALAVAWVERSIRMKAPVRRLSA